jgi:putative flippase GtrA
LAVALSVWGKRASIATLVKYAVTGGVATALYAAVLSVLTAHTGIPAPAASPVASISVIGPAYLGHRFFSFESTNPPAREFAGFLGTTAASLVLGSIVVLVAVDLLALRPFYAGILAATSVAGAAFVLNSRWVFAKGKPG